MSPMTRRQFLQIGAVGVGAASLGTGALSLVAGAAPRGGGGTPTTRNKLTIPIGLAGSSLVAQAGRIGIGGGRETDVLLYNGQFPGPTIEVAKGSSFAATLTNRLADPSMIHWHGLIVPTAVDGQPQDAVPGDGGTKEYAFPVNQRASLNFYHPHPHHHTGSQVYFGLAGAFIVRDDGSGGEEAFLLNVPEYPLVVRDASFDSTKNLAYGGKASGFLGKEPMVNGTLAPYLDVDRAVTRFRIVNAATARIFRLTIPGLSMRIIGNDGGLLRAPFDLTTIDLSPGERVDVLVDLRATAAPILLRCALAGWDLLELRPTTTIVTDEPSIPEPLSSPEVLGAPVTTRQFSFDGMTRINGKVYDPDVPLFTVPAGQVEEWTFTTNGNAPHPVHVHGASFQVIDRTGGRNARFPWETGWKDTVLLNDGETVKVRIRFAAEQAGERYLIHCHKLEHEDAGMMARFDVVAP